MQADGDAGGLRLSGRRAWAAGAGGRVARAPAEGDRVDRAHCAGISRDDWRGGRAPGSTWPGLGRVCADRSARVRASGFASGFAGFLPTQVARHPSSRAVLWLEAAPASVLGLSPEACSGDPGYPNRCGSFAWGAPASTGSRGGPTGCAAAPLPRSCSSRHQAPALGDRGQGQGTEASSALAGTTGRGPAWPGVRRELWARGPAADWEPCPSGVI